MDLSKIIAISGYPGLYKVIAQARNGIIVESLIDKKRMNAYSHYRISGLEDITVFTTSDDKPLKEVLKAIRDKENSSPIEAAKADLPTQRRYILSIVPDLDAEKVHDSDIKKMLSWYNLLQSHDLLKDTEEAKTEQTTEAKADVPVKKARKESSVKAKADVDAPKTKVSTKAPRKTATVRKT
ncbi:MAG: hypothetical protein RLZZ46_231, partial [Bacteroidota bacterium]